MVVPWRIPMTWRSPTFQRDFSLLSWFFSPLESSNHPTRFFRGSNPQPIPADDLWSRAQPPFSQGSLISTTYLTKPQDILLLCIYIRALVPPLSDKKVMLHYFLGIIKRDKPLLLQLDPKTPTYWRFSLAIVFHLRLSYRGTRREDLVRLRLAVDLSIRENAVSRSFCTRLSFFFYF